MKTELRNAILVSGTLKLYFLLNVTYLGFCTSKALIFYSKSFMLWSKTFSWLVFTLRGIQMREEEKVKQVHDFKEVF